MDHGDRGLDDGAQQIETARVGLDEAAAVGRRGAVVAQEGPRERRHRRARPLRAVAAIAREGRELRAHRLETVELRGRLEQRARGRGRLQGADVGQRMVAVQDRQHQPAAGSRGRPATRARSSPIIGVVNVPAA